MTHGQLPKASRNCEVSQLPAISRWPSLGLIASNYRTALTTRVPTFERPDRHRAAAFCKRFKSPPCGSHTLGGTPRSSSREARIILVPVFFSVVHFSRGTRNGKRVLGDLDPHLAPASARLDGHAAQVQDPLPQVLLLLEVLLPNRGAQQVFSQTKRAGLRLRLHLGLRCWLLWRHNWTLGLHRKPRGMVYSGPLQNMGK